MTEAFPLETEMVVVEQGETFSSLSADHCRLTDPLSYNENRDSLLFELKLRLKAPFGGAFDSFHLTLSDNSETKEVILSDECDKREEITLRTLKLDTSYAISVVLTAENKRREFVGSLLCGVDIDGTLVVELPYREILPPVMTRSSPNFYEESGENGSTATAINMSDKLGCNFFGYISVMGDQDYYKFVSTVDGYADMTLTSPGMTYQLGVIDGANLYWVYGSQSGVSLYRRISLVKGRTYYVIVSGTGSNYTHYYRYTLNVNVTAAKAWYSQMHAGNLDGKNDMYYWNTKFLDNLYFNNGTKPFMVNGTSSNTKNDWMYTGCFLSSIAMVLRNMNAKMNGFDFRRAGYEGPMIADPYTVMLANIGKTGSEITVSNDKYYFNGVKSDPTDVARYQIAAAFGKTWNEEILSGTVANKVNQIAAKLASNPEGVIVAFSNPHFVVIGGDTGVGTTGSRFIMYDAGSAYASTGNGQPLAAKYNLANASKVYWMD